MHSIEPCHLGWPWVTFEGHFVDLLTVVTLCAQLTCSLLAIAEFLVSLCHDLLSFLSGRHRARSPHQSYPRVAARQRVAGRRRRQWQAEPVTPGRLHQLTGGLPDHTAQRLRHPRSQTRPCHTLHEGWCQEHRHRSPHDRRTGTSNFELLGKLRVYYVYTVSQKTGRSGPLWLIWHNFTNLSISTLFFGGFENHATKPILKLYHSQLRLNKVSL